ncbi:hypothetical protein GCM10009799_38880 [Nocardiopsis rhodophaea]|uniref:DUF397 domain-containing protein n=2 Tax=Nocardiopsis rhodophaea TaxID=280238 RepID=A0ABN2TFQ5_9ACTN
MDAMRQAWHTSSYSVDGPNCVEVSEGPETRIRDTQNRHLGDLRLAAAEWARFVAAASRM